MSNFLGFTRNQLVSLQFHTFNIFILITLALFRCQIVVNLLESKDRYVKL